LKVGVIGGHFLLHLATGTSPRSPGLDTKQRDERLGPSGAGVPVIAQRAADLLVGGTMTTNPAIRLHLAIRADTDLTFRKLGDHA